MSILNNLDFQKCSNLIQLYLLNFITWIIVTITNVINDLFPWKIKNVKKFIQINIKKLLKKYFFFSNNDLTLYIQ